MGLALSAVLAYTVTQGMKNIFGKPRPNMLDRCNPDITNISKYSIGNFAERFNAEWILVDVGICQQTDKGFLDDGFKSFPSGHASSKFTLKE
jgi:membrane-associated phospholipid phosphatase